MDAKTLPTDSLIQPVALTDKSRRFYELIGYLCVGVVALGEFVRYQFLFAWLPLLTNGDASQHVWWMHRWRDPELFQNDLLFDYFASPSLSPPGHRGLYWLLVQVWDPVAAAEWLPLGMLLVFCGLIYVLGKRLGGGRVLGGIAALGMFVITGVGVEFVGGFARCHALIILAVVAIGWQGRDGRWVGVGLLYGALFYPMIAALAGAITILFILVNVVTERSLAAEWAGWRWPSLVVLGGLVAGGLLVYFQANALPSALGPQVTAAQARQMPEFGELGRNVFFIDDAWNFYFLGKRTGVRATPTAFFTCAALIALTVFALPRIVPRFMWVLLTGSFAMWGLAHLVLFALYLPSRYVKYSLPLFMIMWAAVLLPRLLPALRQHRSFRRAERLLLRPWILLPGMLVVSMGYGLVQLESARGDFPARNHPFFTAGLEETLDYLQTLPKDTLVGCHPYDGDLVPLLAKRSVLANYECALAYHLGYYNQISQRTQDLLQAVYATDWTALRHLHDAYGVDVMLVNARRYTEAESHYFPPFNESTRSLYEAGKTGGFAALDPPPGRVLFQRGDLTVLWLGPLEALPSATP